jgi:hypothetical protein
MQAQTVSESLRALLRSRCSSLVTHTGKPGTARVEIQRRDSARAPVDQEAPLVSCQEHDHIPATAIELAQCIKAVSHLNISGPRLFHG